MKKLLVSEGFGRRRTWKYSTNGNCFDFFVGNFLFFRFFGECLKEDWVFGGFGGTYRKKTL
jgi:hypothetical protein